jgi:hypothetical protein
MSIKIKVLPETQKVIYNFKERNICDEQKLDF